MKLGKVCMVPIEGEKIGIDMKKFWIAHEWWVVVVRAGEY
jgi:hypothetical protein